ncbi:unnamed protein product [Pylaiella littoralis]
METAVDFLTQNWDYGPEVCMIAFALFHSARVRKIEKDNGKHPFWAESLVMTYMMVFGGGILAPFLLGKPPVMLVNDLVVPVVAVCWFISNRAEGSIFALINTPLMKQVISILAECFRANSMCGIVVLSNSILKPGKHYPIALWGPILLGTVAGCGGLFMPLDKGLKASCTRTQHGLKNGAPWALQSAFYGSAFFNLFVYDPNVGPYLRDAAGNFMEGDLVTQGKAIVAGFLCACAIGQTVMGPAFNPFTPMHNVAYTVTGVPSSEAVAVATAEKPKAD